MPDSTIQIREGLMQFSPVRVLSIVSLAALPFAAVAWTPPARTAEDGPQRAIEVRRIRLHFDSVLTELGDARPTGLTTSQRKHRAELMATLEGYRDRGVFPHNYDFPGRAVPYFVDRKTGTLCAVGFLLESTGRRDIVDRVAKMDNNVYVAELARDSAFNTWLGENGITLAEAARIQVPYMGPIDVTPSISSNNNATAYKVGSGVAITGALLSTIWNARPNRDGHGRVANVLGATAGVAALGLGVARLGYRDAPPALAVANMLAGAGSAWVSTRGMLRHHRSVVAAREATRLREAAEVSVSPVVMPSTSGTTAGVSVSVRF